MRRVPIGNRLIGGGEPCYIIAEIGSNHDRKLDQARSLIEHAAGAGVDAVKFQTFSGKSLYSKKAPRFEYLGKLADRAPHELLDEISLPREWQATLAKDCAKKGVDFLSSPFDREAVDQLAELNVIAYKVASFEIVDLGLIRYIAAKKKPMILSTGMASLGEIEEAISAAMTAGAPAVCLLQCTSLYPAPPSSLNLRAIPVLSDAFGVPVGLSDHSEGIHLAPAAVAMGASLVEKHLTVDRSLSGPDHSFSIEPVELAQFVRHIRETEAALGEGQKHGPSEAEAHEMYTKARRSIIANRDIPAGAKITREMLAVKRPGIGLKPRLIDAVIGRIARRDIEEDEPITWEMI